LDLWEAKDQPSLSLGPPFFIHPPLHSSNHVLIHPSSLPIARLKTICSLVAAGIAPVVAALKDWLFGQE